MTDDDQLRALLEDAVADVEPRRALDEIRSRTTRLAPRAAPGRGAPAARSLATAATIAAVAVLSGGPGTTDAGPGPATGDERRAAIRPTRARPYDVYFVGKTSHGPRLFDEPHPVVGERPGRACCSSRSTGRATTPTTTPTGRTAPRSRGPAGREHPRRHPWSSTCPARR